MRRKTLSLLLVLLISQLSLLTSYQEAAFGLQLSPLQSNRSSEIDSSLSHSQNNRGAVLKNRGAPLWPGSRFTELDRQRALSRAMRFIYRTSLNPKNFDEYGSDYLWCFYTLSRAVRDDTLRRMGHRMGVERALHWRRLHRSLPRDADAATIADFAFGSDAADGLDVHDERLKAQIRRAAPHYSARDYLLFDPLTEPPPDDMPDECEFDGTVNPRGSKTCQVCKRPLTMRSRYDVWYDALITTYGGDHYGVKLGAHYKDVLKWMPTLKPYRGSEHQANPDFYDTVYAITHVVYTLNNYSMYRLSPKMLPDEFEFLKTNLKEAIAEGDSDMLGEFMDSLRSLGLTSDEPEIRAGMEYYLSHQNRDGSWGEKYETDIYERYHPTWNGIAGLSEYAWQYGEGLSFPELKPFLEQLAQEGCCKTSQLPDTKLLAFSPARQRRQTSSALRY